QRDFLRAESPRHSSPGQSGAVTTAERRPGSPIQSLAKPCKGATPRCVTLAGLRDHRHFEPRAALAVSPLRSALGWIVTALQAELQDGVRRGTTGPSSR